MEYEKALKTYLLEEEKYITVATFRWRWTHIWHHFFSSLP